MQITSWMQRVDHKFHLLPRLLNPVGSSVPCRRLCDIRSILPEHPCLLSTLHFRLSTIPVIYLSTLSFYVAAFTFISEKYQNKSEH